MGKCLYTVILWVAILAPLRNTILLLIDQKKLSPVKIMPSTSMIRMVIFPLLECLRNNV